VYMCLCVCVCSHVDVYVHALPLQKRPPALVQSHAALLCEPPVLQSARVCQQVRLSQ
jgi:hypothetical protein